MAKGKAQKSFMTQKKKPKTQNKPPETADEYLAAGVELEEAGEKWRAGDAAKASRFFVRAIEMYDEGLSLFPNFFDMAYNKARIQYDITQRPSLLSEARAPLAVLLNEALDSHRRALQLEPNSPDVMFNTAQVLVSLAEGLDDNEPLSITSLQEALTLLERCYVRQEPVLAEAGQHLYEERNDDPDAHGDGGGVPLEGAVNPDAQEEISESSLQWASVVEPTTHSSLVDTCCAGLDALSAWYGFVDTDGRDMAPKLEELMTLWISRLDLNVANVEDSAGRDQARCATLRCQSASLEAAFRLGAIDVVAYSQRLKSALEIVQDQAHDVSRFALADAATSADGTICQTAQFLCTAADALTSFSVVVADVPNAATARWTKLTTALVCLERASKLAQASEAASIHLGRGDTELFRFSLCLEGDLPDNISNQSSRTRLLKNAETYYKGAVASALSQASSLSTITTAATVKLIVVMSLANHTGDAMAQLRNERIADAEISKVLAELVDESIVTASTLQETGLI